MYAVIEVARDSVTIKVANELLTRKIVIAYERVFVTSFFLGIV